ncbi:DUF7507 domain-containing protein, partial [Candidatus Ulvibacter alkanivorans]|uniref:DUF7507 domain-containing protein n=1 Tax=Candidatus Ulvibacter alkanivorans TaxID=2267620 RepID=UPI00109C06DB
MKNQLTTSRMHQRKSLIFTMIFFVFCVGAIFSQNNITLEKVAEESTLCNQFDVTLTVTGNPPPIAQDVILVIDRSGSMQGDPLDFAQDAAIDFVTQLFDNNPTGNNRVGIVSYSTSGTLEIGLRDSSFESAIIAEINNLNASGGTNIARAMDVADNEMTANGNFGCATGRSIILLTDGVTNRRLNGNSCSGIPSPPYPANNNACMNDAINEGVGAQTTTVSGEVYTQNIYSVGLFSDISGNAQAAATHVLDEIQNSGLFTTENAADLSGIYSQILNQLALAARNAVVTDVLGAGFDLVPGSISLPADATYNAGNKTITWDIGNVSNESKILEYTIEATGMVSCGIQNSGMTEMTYEDSACIDQTDPFPNPQVCVPCPDISDPVIDQVDCTNAINYSATFDPGDCTPFSISFEWEFFLNNVSVGTASGTTMADLSGTFTYTGGDPFEGDFRAELEYTGTYNNNCNLPPVTVDSSIDIYLPPNAPISGGDQAECATTPTIQTLTASATVGANQTVVWYDAPTNGTVVNDPSLNVVDSVTYYAETVDNTSGCSSTSRTPVTLTLYNCAINIEKTASPNNPNSCNPISAGQSINYTFSVTNPGNVGIENVTVTDDLIDPLNPIPGPNSGDTSNPGILDVGEEWIYTASYTVLPTDIINGQVFNEAEVDGTVTGSSSSFNVNDLDSETVELCQNAEISITKASVSDTGNCIAFDVNDTIDYTFNVVNEGDVAISNVVVTDPILGGVIPGPASGDTVNPGVLDVGETWIYEASLTVTQAEIDAGSVINTAEVEGDTLLGDVDNTSNQVTVLICQNPAIALVKESDYNGFDTSGNCIAAPGDQIDYTFTVTNQGNVSLSNILLSDPLPNVSAFTFVGGDSDNDTQLDVTEIWVYTATYAITQDD